MADTKISALTSLTGSGVDIAADLFAIVDAGASETKKIVISNALGAAFTTAGDIVQASAAGVAARLGIGTARQVPTVNSGATALAYANPITITAAQATTSGTAFDFTGIPAGVRRITIFFGDNSLSGTDNLLVQIGDAGGPETTGYVSSGGGIGNAGASAVVSSTAGFLVYSATAANTLSGTMTLNLVDIAAFQWSSNHAGKINTVATIMGGGYKSLSQELTQVRVTRTGTDTFDAGSLVVMYE